MNVSNIRHVRAVLFAGACILPWSSLVAQGPSLAADGKAVTPRAGDIVVTGRSLADDGQVALPITVLAGDELAHRRQGGLGETLAGLPGIHLDNFGGGASRPVIRGQTLPRIEILSDGANVFDAASVSPDHAIATDPLLLDAIEIQRGPAAVRYGGNAMNGAINLIDGKVPTSIPAGGLSGATEVRHGTGDQEKTVVGRVTAGIGAFAVHVEGSSKSSEDYDVPDAYGSDKLRDSFADSASYSAGASWITSKGYLGAAYTRQTNSYGLPGHSHANGACHTHAIRLHCAIHGSITHPFRGLDDTLPATIDLRSDRVDIRGDYDSLVPGLDHIRMRFSYTDYAHRELDGRLVFAIYTNKVYDGRVEATHQPVLGFTGTLGVQYTSGLFGGIGSSRPNIRDNQEKFRTDDFGVFLTERRSIGIVDFAIAARKDWRTINVVHRPYEELLPASFIAKFTPEELTKAKAVFARSFEVNFPESDVSPFSVSLSATANMSDGFFAGVSLGQSQRAPGVRELYAKNNNLATSSYEIGLARTEFLRDLPRPVSNILETAKSIDANFGKKGGTIEFDVGLYYKNIDNYIFARFLNSEPGAILLAYTPADVRFLGVDGQISYRLDARSQVTVYGDYVDADLKGVNGNLPRLPPGRLGVRYALTEGPVSADVDYSRTFAQNRFASYETRTAGYDNLNATFAYRFDVGPSKSVEFYVRGTNLTNQLAFAHTSFVMNQSPLRGRNVVLGMRHQF